MVLRANNLDKVDVPNLVTFLSWTLIFEWYVVRVGFKNGYQENTCLKERERERTMYPKSYINHFGLNKKHNLGGPTWPLN